MAVLFLYGLTRSGPEFDASHFLGLAVLSAIIAAFSQPDLVGPVAIVFVLALLFLSLMAVAVTDGGSHPVAFTIFATTALGLTLYVLLRRNDQPKDNTKSAGRTEE